MEQKDIERFMNKVEFDPSSGCWLWLAGKDRKGYGCFNLGVTRRAHRVSYEHFVGPIQEGLTLDHLCRQRACVNPEHLEPVTNAVNILRGDTIAARNAAKTHCIRGHEFNPENTFLQKNGTRGCRTCRNAHVRAFKARKKAEALRDAA